MFDQLGLDKLFGHAMYALLTRIAREICFRDSNELAVFAADELAHYVTASPQGLARSTASSATVASTAHPFSWHLRTPATSATRSPVAHQEPDPDTVRPTPSPRSRTLEWFQEGFSKNPSNVQTITEGLSPLAPTTRCRWGAAVKRSSVMPEAAWGRSARASPVALTVLQPPFPPRRPSSPPPSR